MLRIEKMLKELGFEVINDGDFLSAKCSIKNWYVTIRKIRSKYTIETVVDKIKALKTLKNECEARNYIAQVVV